MWGLGKKRDPVAPPFVFSLMGGGGVRRSERINEKRGNVGVAGQVKARK